MIPRALAPATLRTGGSLADARRSIEGALATSAASDRARVRILAFIDAHPDALQRSCAPGHLTASALVVHPDRARVLVMLHAKLGRWLQPGGHADGEGHLATVAAREAEEETGIAGLTVLAPVADCDVHRIPARGAEPEHLHLDVRHVVLAPPDPRPTPNHESRALCWASPRELSALDTDDSLRRLAAVGLELARATGTDPGGWGRRAPAPG